ncbi:SRPBCC domain-containing protein [Arthrobacter sp. Y-9]|uniref:SRPBCC family protein n=1 Tax=Arthrobacter sp. Y-9 TaxID=3039385 RepID=UPI00241EC594|nr:SRPBCC domain-containing protein [Arthrobacter sp. Y-9]WFR84186.1 SRPBCC domain-containing protein [Arthrobacter sp. Y-9]
MMTENPETAENAIRLERHFPHPIERVWEAITTPELLARWWAAGDIAPVVGHRFTLDMAHWGEQRCEVLAVEPGRSLTILFAEGVLDTTITWRLESVADGTVLHFEHAGFRLDTPAGRQALDGMGHGWPGVLGRIETVLAETT